MNDGSFGVTDGCGAFEPEMIDAIEQHRFAPLRAFYWRNRDLGFSSVDHLLTSLEAPTIAIFISQRRCADHPLIALAGRADIRNAITGVRDVRLLQKPNPRFSAKPS